MLDLLLTRPDVFLFWAAGLVIAVTIHEFSHAFVADRLGDPTPKALGRVTLNPLAHLDPVGTIALLIAHIGWGKPVPFDPYNLENPRRDTVLISLAGPLSNFILAILLSILYKIMPDLAFICLPMVILNVGLGVFNLIPIPPLDGSKILANLLSYDKAAQYEELTNRYGIFLLLLFLFPIAGQSLASIFISPLITLILNLLI